VGRAVRISLDEFRELLKSTTPHDFNGHSEFYKLTAEEKLMWLSQCARFYAECVKCE
jgi:hypothetical protein